MKTFIVIGTVGFILLGLTTLYTYTYNEPDRFFEDIRTSIKEDDKDKELASLDVAEIREKTRLRLEGRLKERVFLDVGSESCHEIADLLGAGLVTKQLDDLLSLENIERLLKSDEDKEEKKKSPPLGRYINISTYKFILTIGETSHRHKISIIMKRTGLGSWVINDIEFPIDDAILDKIGLESAIMSESLANLCAPKPQTKYSTEIPQDMRKLKPVPKSNKQSNSNSPKTDIKRSDRACEIERDLKSKGINIPVIGCNK